VDLARQMTSASSPEDMHPVLADATIARIGVDAVAVLRVSGDRLVTVTTRNLPAALDDWSVDADELEHVGPRLCEASGHAESRVMMLVVGGNIYGVLVMLSRSPIELSPERAALAEAIVDLAATAAERVESHGVLAKSYADLKASRDALARSERLRVLGQMAAGISHDVKNILNPLGLQLEVIRRRIAKGDVAGAMETLDTMRDVIAHGVDIVERLRQFSRQGPETSEHVDVEQVIRTAVELSRPRVALVAGIELEVATIPPLAIRARASELATAIVNLIVNATEAMADGGTIAISAGERDGEIWIEVADNGPGMPSEIADSVFEPFFTTKHEGTGLGLAMIYAFVQRFSGRITMATTPGKGTTFTLYFPKPA